MRRSSECNHEAIPGPTLTGLLLKYVESRLFQGVLHERPWRHNWAQGLRVWDSKVTYDWDSHCWPTPQVYVHYNGLHIEGDVTRLS